MPMLIGLSSGPQTLGKTGSTGNLRGGNTGEAVTSQLLPNYAQIGLDGNTFSAANAAAQAVSVALATTYTGLLLFNPLNSGVILLPKLVKYALSVAPAGIATIGLISGYQGQTALSGTTALTVRNSQVGNSKTGAGQAYSAATIVTPVWNTQLIDGFTAGALYAGTMPFDLRGSIQILPGGFIAVGALTAVTGLGSLSWDEVPLTS